MTWWWEGNRLERVAKRILLAAIYGLMCWAARAVSIDQFYLPAGIRLAALILFPPRLWLYLLIGEYAYFAHMRIPMIGKYGAPWVVLSSITLLPTVALIVRLHLKRINAEQGIWILSAAALSALSVSALNISFAHMLMPTPPRYSVAIDALRFSLGDYLGMLTVVPLAMLWKSRNALFFDAIIYAKSSTIFIVSMLTLAIAAAFVPAEHDALKTLLQIAMGIPAIALTCLHGWRGAALAIPIMNLVVGTTSISWSLPSWQFDQRVFTTQQILAVAGTAMLCVGSSISQYYYKHMAGARRERLASAHAKTTHISTEMELRRRALSMRNVGDGIDHSLSEIAHCLRETGHQAFADNIMQVAVANSRSFREQTSMVYPTCLEHVGLYLTLQVSGIADEWERSGRLLSPRLCGDPCKLTVGLQLAAYRSLTEAVSLVLSAEAGTVLVRARCGRASGHQGILITVGLGEKWRTLSYATRSRLMARLTGRTLAYPGIVNCRGGRVRILLTERATTRTAVEHDLNADPMESERRRTGNI